MEKLTITTPSDILGFIGHTLGFWPQESLVCITLNENSIGATLRIDTSLDTDPAYRLARLSDQMIGSGMVAGWSMNEDTAYKTLPFDLP